MITGAQAIVRALEAEQVTTVFGYPGAAIMPFYDALLDSSIKHVLTRHEQGAAHAASGYARASGRTAGSCGGRATEAVRRRVLEHRPSRIGGVRVELGQAAMGGAPRRDASVTLQI